MAAKKKTVHKLKSKAAKRDIKGIDERNRSNAQSEEPKPKPKSKSKQKQSWIQPLQRHVNAETDEIVYVTIAVRVLSQVEHTIMARLPPSETLFCSLVTTIIAEREHLTPEEAQLFSLWVISKDLELQIRPDTDLFSLMVGFDLIEHTLEKECCSLASLSTNNPNKERFNAHGNWNRWILKYTHYPEAEDPTDSINRHWFVYKREASVTLEAERRISGEYAMSIFLGEAWRNYKTARYIVSAGEAAIIAGYQLQILQGPYRKEKAPEGFISGDRDFLSQLIPFTLIDTQKPEEWEEMIMPPYKQNQKLTALECRIAILDFFRNHPCYGASFFPCCHQLPPSGFFELRTQLWTLGIGPNGISIIDSDIHKYIALIPWNIEITHEGLQYTKVQYGVDQLIIKYTKNGKFKEMNLISPQAAIAENLATRFLYKWAKTKQILMPKSKKKSARAPSRIINTHEAPDQGTIALRIQEHYQQQEIQQQLQIEQQLYLEQQQRDLQQQQWNLEQQQRAIEQQQAERRRRAASHIVSPRGGNLPRDQQNQGYSQQYAPGPPQYSPGSQYMDPNYPGPGRVQSPGNYPGQGRRQSMQYQDQGNYPIQYAPNSADAQRARNRSRSMLN